MRNGLGFDQNLTASSAKDHNLLKKEGVLCFHYVYVNFINKEG